MYDFPTARHTVTPSTFTGSQSSILTVLLRTFKVSRIELLIFPFQPNGGFNQRLNLPAARELMCDFILIVSLESYELNPPAGI